MLRQGLKKIEDYEGENGEQEGEIHTNGTVSSFKLSLALPVCLAHSNPRDATRRHQLDRLN